MLSRIAESMFWIGRYVERAEDTARILDVQTQHILEDAATDEETACRSLLAVMGIEPAADPAHPVGTEVTLMADHMPGMEGAAATVVGAYETTAYSVDYRPTTGGPEVTDHKWVVQEELEDAGAERLPDGAAVTLAADHMPGMQGAEGTVHSSTDETVYMVDYESDGMRMRNHKWVVESEIASAG